MYTIGEVSKLCNIPISTIRYYDKEGLFINIKRENGIRKFTDHELEILNIIECLKKSGLEIKDIKKYMQWCEEGESTYTVRKELFERQKNIVEEKIEHLNNTLSMLKFKCWYYDELLEKHNEAELKEIIPDKLPKDIKELYERGHM